MGVFSCLCCCIGPLLSSLRPLGNSISSRVFHVSAYRNSRVCPIHFTRLEGTSDWHTLQCPLGHFVDRDYASVLNMAWKLTPEAFWWNMKKNMNWRKHENKSNPLIPYTIVQYLHAMLKTFTASEESPAVLARGSPMNPAGGANEGWARKPPKKGGGQPAGLINQSA